MSTSETDDELFYIWPRNTQSSKQHVSYNKDCCASSHVPTDALKVGFQGAKNLGLSRLHGNEKKPFTKYSDDSLTSYSIRMNW